MLEKMDLFFENRLEEYEKHMLSGIEGAREFYPFTASLLPEKAGCEVLDLGCGTGLELDAYFLRNPEALEREYFRTLERLKREQNLSADGFYHYDTPLTVEHEREVLREAGFSDVRILKHWAATYAVRAAR